MIIRLSLPQVLKVIQQPPAAQRQRGNAIYLKVTDASYYYRRCVATLLTVQHANTVAQFNQARRLTDCKTVRVTQRGRLSIHSER